MDPVRDGPAIRARLGVCPQLDNLDPELTVRENLTTYARYFGIPRRVARARAAELLDFVQLTERAEQQGRAAVRRHEAAAHHRPRAGQRARARAARRADHRPRPAGPAPGLGAAVPAQAARRDAGADHALHGRGRAALRPARGDGRRQDRRRGLAARADRAATPPARWSSCASATSRRRRTPSKLAGIGERVEVLPDRILLYAADGDARRRPRCTGAARPRPACWCGAARLEDVFLHLTGRTLVD